MTRFLLFTGMKYYPSRAARDLKDQCSSLQQAKARADERKSESFTDWQQILELDSMILHERTKPLHIGEWSEWRTFEKDDWDEEN